jgi:hypothetical protein
MASVVDLNNKTKYFFLTDAASSMCLELPSWLLTAGNSYRVGVCGLALSEVNTSQGVYGFWLSEYDIAEHRAGESCIYSFFKLVSARIACVSMLSTWTVVSLVF